MNDPSGINAQQLLEEHDIAAASFSPWWATTNDHDDPPPPPTNIFPIPIPPHPTGSDPSKFCFNLFAIWFVMSWRSGLHIDIPNARHIIFSLGYAFTTRHLVTSPLATLTQTSATEDDASAARHDIAQTVPFLIDRKSTIMFESVDQVITEVWSRLDNVRRFLP